MQSSGAVASTDHAAYRVRRERGLIPLYAAVSSGEVDHFEWSPS